MTISFRQAIIPRAFAHWNRIKIQAWQTLGKRPVQGFDKVVPGKNPRLESAINWVDRRIETLQQSHAVFMEKVLENVNDGVILMRPDGNMSHINQKLLDLTGYSLKEALGKGPWEFVHEDHRELVLESIVRVQAGESIEPTEVVVLKKNGGEIPMEFTASLLTASSGERSISVVVRNITERKEIEAELKASELRFRSVTEMAQDAIMMITGHEISLWNPAAERVFGYTANELRGRKFYELLVPKHAQRLHEAAMSRFAETGKAAAVGKTLEVTARHKDGHNFPIELSISSVNFGSKWHAIVIVRDITDRKRDEKALENQKLRNVELRMANRLLMTVTDWLGQVWQTVMSEVELANMSFESIARGFIEVKELMPKDKYDALMQDLMSAGELMKTMSMLSDRVSGMIGDARVFARPMEGLNLKKIDLSAVVDSCIADCGRSIIFSRQSGLPKVEADVVLIKDALSRFIKSALVASARAENGKVLVSVERNRHEIAITIEDSGTRFGSLFVGILRAPPFVHGETFNYEEYLGLSIALKYIEAHGGRVYFVNKESGGTAVKIWLPIEAK